MIRRFTPFLFDKFKIYTIIGYNLKKGDIYESIKGILYKTI